MERKSNNVKYINKSVDSIDKKDKKTKIGERNLDWTILMEVFQKDQPSDKIKTECSDSFDWNLPNNEYHLVFSEIKPSSKEPVKYNKTITLYKNIEEYSKEFFLNIFKKAKESFLAATIIILSSISLTSCTYNGYTINNDLNSIKSNQTLAPYVLNDSFRPLQDYYQWEISFLSAFNNYNPLVYKQKWTAHITVPDKFKQFVTSDWQIALEDVLKYITSTTSNQNTINELYKVDWTVFQRWSLYETVNADKDQVIWDLWLSIKRMFEKDYGKYNSYDAKDIMSKEIALVSDFTKSKLYRWNEEESKVILDAMFDVVGNFSWNEEKTITLNDLLKINNKIIKAGQESWNQTIEMRWMYANFILNNLIFLLTQSPKEYVDGLLSNGLKFEVWYWDKWYIDILGHIIYSKNAKITYDKAFKKEVSSLNDEFKKKKKDVEIILESNSVIISENWDIVAPGELKSAIRFFNSNPDSEIKKLVVNSTLLSDYLTENFNKITKESDKKFFINGVQKLISAFKKDFNLSDKDIESIFKYWDINGWADSVSIYGVNIDVKNAKYSNVFSPDYYEKIVMNNPNFTTILHEWSHKYHLNKINDNINEWNLDFITQINSYPYTSNYKNDPVFKKIFQELFYRAYKWEIKTSELDYFWYYALSTFNFFEFVAELNSAYLSYPKYNQFIKEQDPENSKLFLWLQKEVHSFLAPKINN